jgi:hypothetical protein
LAGVGKMDGDFFRGDRRREAVFLAGDRWQTLSNGRDTNNRCTRSQIRRSPHARCFIRYQNRLAVSCSSPVQPCGAEV